MYVSAIIAAGGRGTRFGGARPKQFLTLGGRPILQWGVEAFLASSRIDEVVVAVPEDVAADPPPYLRGPARVRVVVGGARRQDSVANAFAAAARAEVVVIHDAARPFVSAALIASTLDAAIVDGAAIAALPARDTVKRGDADRFITGTLRRDEIFLAQTPQAFRAAVLRDALALATSSSEATDEAMLAEQAGHRVRLVEGDPRNVKITTPVDLAIAAGFAANVSGPSSMRIGNGYDLHRLVPGRPLILGGVTIPFAKGLQGHSDADAVCHAITDAILGAASAGDIGRHFPDTDAAWKDANSLDLLARAVEVVIGSGYAIGNVDVVVIAQQPKLAPYVDAMRAKLSQAMGIDAGQVSIKGKTNEAVDSMGMGESIAVHAVALLIGSGDRFRTVSPADTRTGFPER